MTSNEKPAVNAAVCPLCGGPNACQQCTVAVSKGPCWCTLVKIPEELLARVPAAAKNQACLCRDCVMKYHRTHTARQPEPVQPGDFYFETGGLMVFTAAYLLRRGYCCGSGCRHCPYQCPEGSR